MTVNMISFPRVLETRWMKSAFTTVLMLLAGLALVGATAPDSTRIDRARANYEALLQGRIQLGQLTPQDLRDILVLDRALRARDDGSRSQRCVDEEVERFGGSPSRLAWRVIDLKCREIGGSSVMPDD
ncbi:hypothetical protein [Oceaniovalibus sp. ACAM 378]|uniref:hypothetical protein n=1 Tax=Oceaniovalibus sp. ACAM 378 TaxID=2599923 RepID=UPI0011D92B6C|nr:hypothetical protein [Oceaniovalibus sp. ACAM 378]TYB86070.1 hypothetical protein FQ320_17440 [Oceaniovalibus sp. ACAM 378]